MDIILVLLIICLLFVTPAIAIGVYLVVNFLRIKKVTYVSTESWGEVLVYLSEYSNMEDPIEQLAKFSKLSQEEIRVEVERNGIIGILEGIAKTNIKIAKENVPDVKKLLEPIEAKYKR